MRRTRRPHGEPLAALRRLTEMDSDECIEWTGPFNHRGYGTVCRTLAHRQALLLVGPPPFDGAEARHLCPGTPNRRCVNLRHLAWGSRSDNQQDRFGMHGDHHRGERNNRAKLTAAQIAEIRMRRATGERGIDLAAEFGVTPQNISSIYRGHTWAVSNG